MMDPYAVLFVKDTPEDRPPGGVYRGRLYVVGAENSQDAYAQSEVIRHSALHRFEHGSTHVYVIPQEEWFGFKLSENVVHGPTPDVNEPFEGDKYAVVFLKTKTPGYSPERLLPQGIYEGIVAVVRAESEIDAYAIAEKRFGVDRDFYELKDARVYSVKHDHMEPFQVEPVNHSNVENQAVHQKDI